MMELRVLVLNHYGVLSGAARSIIELIKNFPGGEVLVSIVTPKGKIENVIRSSGINYRTILGVSKFDHTKVGFYRGLRWLILVREIVYFFPTLFFFLLNKSRYSNIDIVHLNENTCVVPLILAKRIWKKRTVLHCRAVMNNDNSLFRTRVIGTIFRKYADVLVAIDESVRNSLPAHENTVIVHNGLSIEKSAFNIDMTLEEKLYDIGRRKLNLGFVGALDKNKGIYELIIAVKRCVEKGMDVNLFLLGSTLKSGKGLVAHSLNKIKRKKSDELDDFIYGLNLNENVHRLGFSLDVKSFYSFIDAVCFPTYYYAPGRPVIEGALFGKPSILCVKESKLDTFADGITGLKVDVKNVETVVDAITVYYNNPDVITEHGNNAYKLALEQFDIQRNAISMIDVYKELLRKNEDY